MKLNAFVIAAALTWGAAPAVAQEIAVGQGQQHLVLEVLKLSTFEQELNRAAREGFRLMMATTSFKGARIQALLNRVPPGAANAEYRLVATFSTKTGDKEMNAAAAEGFRVVSHTSMVKTGVTIFNTNSVVVMERVPGTPIVEYLTLTAARTSTFHRELKAAENDGWKVVDMTYGQVLLERPAAR